jgi:hypothetical protein
VAFKNATQCANKLAKAWHTWALFNTAVMSHYTKRGLSNVAAQFVVAAVTGYFHSIACAANAKGVDDSLQVNPGSKAFLKNELFLDFFTLLKGILCSYFFLGIHLVHVAALHLKTDLLKWAYGISYLFFRCERSCNVNGC